MTMANSKQKLTDLLTREREALLAGQLHDLEGIAGEKTKILDELSRAGKLHKEHVHSLRAKAQQNQLLYTAALAGLKSAVDRIQAIRATADGFSVYSPDGQSTTLRSLVRSRSQTA